jgi:PAS domain S-box-containing protein
MKKTFLNNPFSTKIAKKMLFVLLLCSLLPVFTLSLISYFFVRQYLQNSAASEMRQQSGELIQNLNNRLSKCQATFNDFIKVKAKIPTAMTDTEKKVCEKQATILFEFVAIQNDNNIEYIKGTPSSIPTINKTDKLDLKNTGSVFKLDIYNNKPHIFILKQINNFLFIAKVNNSQVFHGINTLCTSWQNNCIIFDKNSQLIYPANISTEVTAPILASPKSHSSNYFIFMLAQKTFMGIKKPLQLQSFFPSSSITMVLFKNRSFIFAPLQTFNRYFSVILAINIVLVLLLCIYIVRRYNSHIEKLYSATNEIAKRNFNHKVHINSNDEFESLAASFNDMSDYLQQTTLSKNQISQTLKSITDGIIVTDINKNVIFMNKSAQNMTGWSEEEAENQQVTNILQLKKDKQTVETDTIIADTLAEEEGNLYPIGGAELVHRNGSELKVVYNINSIQNDSTEVSGAVIVIRDMSQQEHLENQIRQMQKMEALGTMAGSIAHDFNNILGVILGYLELTNLHLTPKDKTLKENLLPIQQAANRAQSLVKQILTFSRQSNIEKKPVMLTPLLKEVSKMLRSTIPASINIKTHFSANPIYIQADPTQIHQVLMNLCTNAYHAMRSSGTGNLDITLKAINDINKLGLNLPISGTSDTTRYALLSVSDTGHGIPQDYLNRIFDPYFTTKKQGEGTGLGLATVKGIIEELNGMINVKSSTTGTTFELYFPILEEYSSETTEAQRKELPRGNNHILLVDDDPDLVKTSCKMLEFLGYTVTPHSNSIEALQYFRQHADTIDLVITDQTMPLLTGTHLCKKLLQVRADIPIILCTGYSESINETSVKAAGIRLLIYKPFNINLLANALYSLLQP